MVYTLRFFFSSKCSLFHNSNVLGSCIIHILYTLIYIKKNNSGAKRLTYVNHISTRRKASDRSDTRIAGSNDNLGNGVCPFLFLPCPAYVKASRWAVDLLFKQAPQTLMFFFFKFILIWNRAEGLRHKDRDKIISKDLLFKTIQEVRR